MNNYLPRVVDSELTQRLSISGAVLLDGPKACGKTETAAQRAKSIVRLDTDVNARQQLQLSPELLFEQATPILFDEWQRAPEVWDHVRRNVDDRREPGLYLLTGSATPNDSHERHSGAGRIGTLRMRPMSLFESGMSSGEASLDTIMNGESQPTRPAALSVSALMEQIVIGGWPSLLGFTESDARRWLADYLDQIVEVDIPSLQITRRAPERLRRTLASLARGVGQPVKVVDIARDVSGGDLKQPVDATIDAYLGALDRLHLTENSPAWRPHLRSRTRLREAATRYFVDPSLGPAALGIGSRELLGDISAAGFHFEGLVVRDLRIYVQAVGGRISSWREANGRKEIDVIIETANGWAAAEVKLTGDQGVIDKAASQLINFAEMVDSSRHGKPRALIVITATGPGGRRADGVHVVPISTLRP